MSVNEVSLNISNIDTLKENKEHNNENTLKRNGQEKERKQKIGNHEIMVVSDNSGIMLNQVEKGKGKEKEETYKEKKREKERENIPGENEDRLCKKLKTGEYDKQLVVNRKEEETDEYEKENVTNERNEISIAINEQSIPKSQNVVKTNICEDKIKPINHEEKVIKQPSLTKGSIEIKNGKKSKNTFNSSNSSSRSNNINKENGIITNVNKLVDISPKMEERNIFLENEKAEEILSNDVSFYRKKRKSEKKNETVKEVVKGNVKETINKTKFILSHTENNNDSNINNLNNINELNNPNNPNISNSANNTNTNNTNNTNTNNTNDTTNTNTNFIAQQNVQLTDKKSDNDILSRQMCNPTNVLLSLKENGNENKNGNKNGNENENENIQNNNPFMIKTEICNSNKSSFDNNASFFTTSTPTIVFTTPITLDKSSLSVHQNINNKTNNKNTTTTTNNYINNSINNNSKKKGGNNSRNRSTHVKGTSSNGTTKDKTGVKQIDPNENFLLEQINVDTLSSITSNSLKNESSFISTPPSTYPMNPQNSNFTDSKKRFLLCVVKGISDTIKTIKMIDKSRNKNKIKLIELANNVSMLIRSNMNMVDKCEENLVKTYEQIKFFFNLYKKIRRYLKKKKKRKLIEKKQNINNEQDCLLKDKFKNSETSSYKEISREVCEAVSGEINREINGEVSRKVNGEINKEINGEVSRKVNGEINREINENNAVNTVNDTDMKKKNTTEETEMLSNSNPYVTVKSTVVMKLSESDQKRLNGTSFETVSTVESSVIDEQCLKSVEYNTFQKGEMEKIKERSESEKEVEKEIDKKVQLEHKIQQTLLQTQYIAEGLKKDEQTDGYVEVNIHINDTIKERTMFSKNVNLEFRNEKGQKEEEEEEEEDKEEEEKKRKRQTQGKGQEQKQKQGEEDEEEEEEEQEQEQKQKQEEKYENEDDKCNDEEEEEEEDDDDGYEYEEESGIESETELETEGEDFSQGEHICKNNTVMEFEESQENLSSFILLKNEKVRSALQKEKAILQKLDSLNAQFFFTMNHKKVLIDFLNEEVNKHILEFEETYNLYISHKLK